MKSDVNFQMPLGKEGVRISFSPYSQSESISSVWQVNSKAIFWPLIQVNRVFVLVFLSVMLNLDDVVLARFHGAVDGDIAEEVILQVLKGIGIHRQHVSSFLQCAVTHIRSGHDMSPVGRCSVLES
jgi:hypothetical protein